MARPGHSPRDDRAPRKGSGLLTGLIIGLVVGLTVAAGLAWYLNTKDKDGYKEVEQAPEAAAPKAKVDAPVSAASTAKPREETPARSTPVHKPAEPMAPIVEAAKPPASKPVAPAPAKPAPIPPAPTRPSVDYTFYGILPGDKPVKPVAPVKVQEIWWLQIAALKNPADADRLKAKITLLGLPVVTQTIESGGQTLHRVRVGPYKKDEDAMRHLDTLSQNNFEARLLKEPVKTP